MSDPTKKKRSLAQMQRDLRDTVQAASKPEGPPKAPVNWKKVWTRIGAVVALLWVIALVIPTWIPKAVVGALTALIAGVSFWLVRYTRKSQALGAILRGADTDEGRKEALKRLETDFKKGDTQALLARAQLEMQDNPRQALETLESINLDKQLGPVGDQVRSMRAMLHLTLGETSQARALVENLNLGKQQDAKTRAMFATVSGEAWARTGEGKKAVETLELFNPEDPEYAEMRIQMWRARAFAYAAANDMKGVGRALRKLAETSPQLLAMFVGSKKVHPLLEREAKQLLMKSGGVPRKMVRQRV